MGWIEKLNEELGNQGFELDQRVWLPKFGQSGTVTGITETVSKGKHFEYRARQINVTLDSGKQIQEPRGRVQVL